MGSEVLNLKRRMRHCSISKIISGKLFFKNNEISWRHWIDFEIIANYQLNYTFENLSVSTKIKLHQTKNGVWMINECIYNEITYILPLNKRTQWHFTI